jgi:hypothetical protein
MTLPYTPRSLAQFTEGKVLSWLDYWGMRVRPDGFPYGWRNGGAETNDFVNVLDIKPVKNGNFPRIDDDAGLPFGFLPNTGVFASPFAVRGDSIHLHFSRPVSGVGTWISANGQIGHNYSGQIGIRELGNPGEWAALHRGTTAPYSNTPSTVQFFGLQLNGGAKFQDVFFDVTPDSGNPTSSTPITQLFLGSLLILG